MLGERILRRTVFATCLAAAVATALAAPARGQVRFSGVADQAAVKVITWRDIPFRTVVRQEYDYSCGSAALATLLTYSYGRPTTESDAFTAMYAAGDQAQIRKVGFSMLDMKHFLTTHGFAAEGYRLSLDELAEFDQPSIALVTIGPYRHFVVVKGISADKVLIGDPALGLKVISRQDFARMWNGVILAIAPGRAAPTARFNQVSEWSPWSTPPTDWAATPPSVTRITRNLPPLYQITPVLILNHGTGG